MTGGRGGGSPPPSVAPFGSWRSPLDAATVAAGRIPLTELAATEEAVYWLEGRPGEGGRNVLMRWSGSGPPEQVTPSGFNVRSRVHEYGGGSYLLAGDTIVFSEFADQRLYRQERAGQPRPITSDPPEPSAHRYADGRLSPSEGTLICVRERHEGNDVVNELVALPADGPGPPVTIAGGRDFYASPRISPDGARLAWLSWDRPRMPWDGTELYVADLRMAGTLGDQSLVAGGVDESIFQPSWSPDGVLHFVSDRTGWWALYRLVEGRVEALIDGGLAQEFGLPQWVLGMSTYAFLPDGLIGCLHGPPEAPGMGIVDRSTGSLRDIDLPFTAFGSSVASWADRFVVIAASAEQPRAVLAVDGQKGGVEEISSSSETTLASDYTPAPVSFEFGTERSRTAHAIFYPPANPAFTGPPGERPPLLVEIHGGPTSHVSPEYQTDYLFWTTRGFGVVDVNYRGSTGYGREYRQRLAGQWGVVDVDDCVAAARYLAERGEVDANRMAIRGGSAGGFTAMAALAFHDVFSAAASYFGVGDLQALARDTHKFESRYLDTLIGPWPERSDLYRLRSPIHHVERISAPVILFQGLEDRVVPPEQSEAVYRALRDRGIPTAYLQFAGEQHGFRRAETISRCLEAELFFYGRVFGFEPADAIEPVEIANLPSP